MSTVLAVAAPEIARQLVQHALALAGAATTTGPVGDDPQSNWWVTHALHIVVGVGIFAVGAVLMTVLTRPPKRRAPVRRDGAVETGGGSAPAADH